MSAEVTSFESLLVERSGALLRVTLSRPETGNAVDEQMLDELLEVLHATADDPGTRVLVLAGDGPDFCLGGDRREFGELMAADPTGLPVRSVGVKSRRVCEALATSSAVTIARLHGGVVGAGLGMAVFCDLRVGSDTSRFRMPELTLGLPPFWGGALARLLAEAGAAHVREFMLTSNNFDAATAERMAIVHRVVPEAELDAFITSWTRPLLRRSPAALRVTKAALSAYAAPARLADATLLEPDLLAAAVADAHHRRR